MKNITGLTERQEVDGLMVSAEVSSSVLHFRIE